mgnify:FL=1
MLFRSRRPPRSTIYHGDDYSGGQRRNSFVYIYYELVLTRSCASLLSILRDLEKPFATPLPGFPVPVAFRPFCQSSFKDKVIFLFCVFPCLVTPQWIRRGISPKPLWFVLVRYLFPSRTHPTRHALVHSTIELFGERLPCIRARERDQLRVFR